MSLDDSCLERERWALTIFFLGLTRRVPALKLEKEERCVSRSPFASFLLRRPDLLVFPSARSFPSPPTVIEPEPITFHLEVSEPMEPAFNGMAR